MSRNSARPMAPCLSVSTCRKMSLSSFEAIFRKLLVVHGRRSRSWIEPRSARSSSRVFSVSQRFSSTNDLQRSAARIMHRRIRTDSTADASVSRWPQSTPQSRRGSRLRRSLRAGAHAAPTDKADLLEPKLVAVQDDKLVLLLQRRPVKVGLEVLRGVGRDAPQWRHIRGRRRLRGPCGFRAPRTGSLPRSLMLGTRARAPAMGLPDELMLMLNVSSSNLRFAAVFLPAMYLRAGSAQRHALRVPAPVHVAALGAVQHLDAARGLVRRVARCARRSHVL